MKVVEIIGVSDVNKGAELMLHSIVQKIQATFNDNHKIAVAPWVMSYKKRSLLGLYQILYMKFRKDFPINIFPEKWLNWYGVIQKKNVNVILDSSGFTYGNQWGVGPTDYMYKLLQQYKKYGSKIIMLPQAFGPFSGKICDIFSKVISIADLVYIRDQISYDNVISVCGKHDKIKIAPDFTSLTAGIVPNYFNDTDFQCCIIPNARMIDKVDKNNNNYYLTFLINCIKVSSALKINPYILAHSHDDCRDN
jgi:colanic acid/amylovoran biosynthesis protein